MRLPSAAEIHSVLIGRWPHVLADLGVDPERLVNRHGPCPACGGKDRFRFDDRDGRGTFYCNHCGAGDGFKLVQLVLGCSFREALHAVVDHAGLLRPPSIAPPKRPLEQCRATIASPPARVRRLLRTCTSLDLVPDAITYLRSRCLWPLPSGCTWQAHQGVEFWRHGLGNSVEFVCRYPALVAKVQDMDGETVTAHVTYLERGAKLSSNEPRKLLSRLVGRRGCAIRLLPLSGEVLGVGEGIENCLSAAVLHGLPVWSCISSSILPSFVPPRGISQIAIFADNDDAGRQAAGRLQNNLDGICQVEVRLPPTPAKDWNDVLGRRCPQYISAVIR